MEGGPIVVNLEGEEEVLKLPPGFRFHPTDEEIITHYLTHKVVNPDFAATALGQVDLNKCEPWDLPKKAKMGEKEWYFFCQRDRKYPTGMRTNRATEIGYWKATGKDKEIYGKAKSHSTPRLLVGMKKTLVFYKGRAPKGEKSNWVMHEFRLDGQFSYHNFPNKSVAKDEWVVCKVFHKKNGAMINKKDSVTELTRMGSFVQGILDSPSLPSLMDSPYNSNANNNGIKTLTTTSHEEEGLKGTIFAPNSYSIAADGNFTNQIQQHSYTTLNPASTTHQSSQTSNYYYNYDIQTMPKSSMFYSQNANFAYQASTSLGHQQSCRFNSTANNPPCKVEHYSSNLSRSQDTGLSTDLATEISSKQQVQRINPIYNADVEGASAAHLEDFDSFWNFQLL